MFTDAEKAPGLRVVHLAPIKPLHHWRIRLLSPTIYGRRKSARVEGCPFIPRVYSQGIFLGPRRQFGFAGAGAAPVAGGGRCFSW
eukprot:73425-Prorocentrum_minimum.AAC.2